MFETDLARTTLGEPASAPRTPAIAAVASALPARSVPNEAIAGRLGVDERWIVDRTGVRERRIAGAGDSLTELAAEAGRRALAAAGLEPDAVDLVLVATLTADDLLPNAAPLVAGSMGARRAGAIDIGAACTGFVAGLAFAAGQVEAGRAGTVLVIGADLLSRVTDADDRRTAALFGDGAGAAVVVPAEREGAGSIGPVLLHADAGGAEWIAATHAERKVRMAGHETFKHATARLAEVTVAAAHAARLGLDEIDLFVYHQANSRIVRTVTERLDLPPERVLDRIALTGNTSSASIPLALATACEEGLLRRGARVLLAAFGAGFTWGGTVVEWGSDAA
jgi:3-oxoacyl-[acyl-carrier-protein] synthase-3